MHSCKVIIVFIFNISIIWQCIDIMYFFLFLIFDSSRSPCPCLVVLFSRCHTLSFLSLFSMWHKNYTHYGLTYVILYMYTLCHSHIWRTPTQNFLLTSCRNIWNISFIFRIFWDIKKNILHSFSLLSITGWQLRTNVTHTKDAPYLLPGHC